MYIKVIEVVFVYETGIINSFEPLNWCLFILLGSNFPIDLLL